MFCTNCGSQLPDGAAFCPMCGNPVAGFIPQPPASPAEEPAYAPPVEAAAAESPAAPPDQGTLSQALPGVEELAAAVNAAKLADAGDGNTSNAELLGQLIDAGISACCDEETSETTETEEGEMDWLGFLGDVCRAAYKHYGGDD